MEDAETNQGREITRNGSSDRHVSSGQACPNTRERKERVEGESVQCLEMAAVAVELSRRLNIYLSPPDGVLIEDASPLRLSQHTAARFNHVSAAIFR